MKEHTQWHDVSEVKEGINQYIVKYYEPNSYEIRNELSWLTSSVFLACNKFRVPLVVDASIREGYIKMAKVEHAPELKPEEILSEIISLAAELHSVIKSPEPRLRNHASAKEFIPYLRDFAEKKFLLMQPEMDLDENIKKLVLKNLSTITSPYFSIVHRDLRYRHVLQAQDKKLVLIDWEFSNISHFGHDLAKLVCDYVVNHGSNPCETLKTVVETYCDMTGLPEDLVFKAVRAFVPLVLLEHSASFIQRKCADYMIVAQRDIDQLSMFVQL